MEENEKASARINEDEITVFRKTEMAIDVAFTFWKIVCVWEARNQKRLLEVRIVRKETIRIDILERAVLNL